VLHLRSADAGAAGQGARYVVAGAIVAVVYLTVTTGLADLGHVPFQIALLIGFTMALGVHFTLQRFFVWVHRERFALSLGKQMGRYLLLAVFQYAVTAATTSALPHALDVSETLVYLATAPTLTAINFLVFRRRVFHPVSR
jgi:putative flippase GtrA